LSGNSAGCDLGSKCSHTVCVFLFAALQFKQVAELLRKKSRTRRHRRSHSIALGNCCQNSGSATVTLPPAPCRDRTGLARRPSFFPAAVGGAGSHGMSKDCAPWRFLVVGAPPVFRRRWNPDRPPALSVCPERQGWRGSACPGHGGVGGIAEGQLQGKITEQHGGRRLPDPKVPLDAERVRGLCKRKAETDQDRGRQKKHNRATKRQGDAAREDAIESEGCNVPGPAPPTRTRSTRAMPGRPFSRREV